jgi:hypothetical protein
METEDVLCKALSPVGWFWTLNFAQLSTAISDLKTKRTTTKEGAGQ